MKPLYSHKTSRRTILRGLGASLTLPFLPSLGYSQAWAQALASEVPPRRFAALLFGNGINVHHWWQKTDAGGKVTELGPTLRPLTPYLDQCLFLNNLHLFDEVSGIHFPYFTNFLVGKEVQRGPVPRLQQSLDHYMARAVGAATPVPCLTLGIEPPGFGVTCGTPAIAYGTISWSSSTTPVAPEIYPRQAFDRLFDTSGLVKDKSVLDYVLKQANEVRGRLVAHDREKLEEYMTSIREIEKRIEVATAEERLEGWRPSLSEPNMAAPEPGKPQNVPEHMRLMLDILVLALQMDKTRVATLLFQRDTSAMQFNFLEGVSNTPLHQLSHHRSQADELAQYQKTNEFHVNQLAYVMGKMAVIEEGNGTTLLDNTAMLFGSSMGDGDIHDGDHLQLLLAGGRSMGIAGGRSLFYDKLEDRRLCNLHLDIAQRMGVTERDEKGVIQPLTAFSNSHYPLPGISM